MSAPLLAMILDMVFTFVIIIANMYLKKLKPKNNSWPIVLKILQALSFVLCLILISSSLQLSVFILTGGVPVSAIFWSWLFAALLSGWGMSLKIPDPVNSEVKRST